MKFVYAFGYVFLCCLIVSTCERKDNVNSSKLGEYSDKCKHNAE